MGAIIFSHTKPGFAMPRSYVAQIAVRSSFASPAFLDGDVIQWTAGPGYVYRVAIVDVWFPWSSNSRTIDHMFDADRSSIDCISFPCFDLVTTGFDDILNDGNATLWVEPFATPGAPQYLTLPPAPPGYWLPGGGW